MAGSVDADPRIGSEIAGYRIERLPGLFRLGSPEVDIDERLARRPDERFIVKKRASAFHGTAQVHRFRGTPYSD